MSARDNWAQVAHDLRVLADSIDAAIEQPAAGSAPSPAPAARPAPPPAAGDYTSCPKHGTPFTPSKNAGWASFCSQTTDDPAWGKPKTDRDGNPVLYCRITSKNAGEWLAVHGRAA